MRLALDWKAPRVREVLPHAGILVYTGCILAAGRMANEDRLFFAAGVSVVLARFVCGAACSAGLAMLLAVAMLLMAEGDGPARWFYPLHVVLVWGVASFAAQGYQRESLKLKLAQEEEAEAGSELGKVLENERVRIAGARQRIEKILMLTSVTNDLSSTLDLRGVVDNTLTWTRELAGHAGEPRILLFDEHGARVFRWSEGSTVVAREEPDPVSVWIRERKTPLLVSDVRRDQRFREVVDRLGDSRSLIATPLIRGKAVIGVLHVWSGAREAFTPEDWRLVSLLGDLTSVAIQNALLYQRTQEEAITDGLTEVFVHRYFQERLAEEMKRAREGGGKLTLLMVDIDNFKAFNDTYGHLTGDTVLRGIAQVLREGVRGTDIVARYGGEEFAVLLVETGRDPGALVAERLRAGVEAYNFQDISMTKPVTVSMGLACFPENAPDERGLIEVADEALYAAKRSGKNRVVMAGLRT